MVKKQTKKSSKTTKVVKKTQKPTITKQTRGHEYSTAKNGKKHCPKCGRVRKVKFFPTDNRRNDKLYIYCRECEAKRQKEKYLRTKIAKAEAQGIDVLKIDVDPNTGKTVETTLVAIEG